MWRGALISVGFHAAVITVAWFGLPDLFRTDEIVQDSPIIVDIVNLEIADKTNLPSAPPEPKPEPPKPEPPKPEPPKPEPPKPEPPKPEPAPPEPEPLPPTTKPEPAPPEPDLAPPPPPPKKATKVAPIPPPKPKALRKKSKESQLASLMKAVEQVKKKRKSAPPKKKKAETGKEFANRLSKSLKGRSSTYSASEPLTISEIDAIRVQIEKCWNVPAGARYAEDLVVDVKVWLNPDGVVRDARIQDTSRMNSDPFYRTAAESARRAVFACSPLKAPPRKYDIWKEVTLTFNPRQMVGR